MFSRRAEMLEKNPPREGERVISTLKPYPAYKPSGVPWLGQVPGALGGTAASSFDYWLHQWHLG